MENAKHKRLHVLKSVSTVICMDLLLCAIIAGIALSNGYEETKECSYGLWKFVILSIAYFIFFVVRNTIILCFAWRSYKPEEIATAWRSLCFCLDTILYMVLIIWGSIQVFSRETRICTYQDDSI